ncbi:AMP-dependent synthetase/ligase [Acidithiobacillus caldus]
MAHSLHHIPSLGAGLLARCAQDPTGIIALERSGDRYVATKAADFAARVRRRASGLLQLGLGTGDRVLLMARNAMDWALMDFAILSIGAVTVPVYPNFGQRELHYILGDCAPSCLLLQDDSVYARMAPQDWGIAAERIFLRESGSGAHSELRSWTDLEHLGETVSPARFQERLAGVERGHLATIVYTSGTTGWPKGVMLNHGNILSNIEGFLSYVPLRAGQRVLSVLPLSHVFERGTSHFGAYLLGLEVAYAERPETLLRDMAAAHPEIVIAVPRVFQLLHQRLRRNLMERRGWTGRLLRRGLGLEDGRVLPGQRALARRLVVDKLRRQLGGKLRYFVSGGAPLEPAIAAFFLDLGLPIVEGYGMTEASPVIAANPLDAIHPGSVGRFLPNLEGRVAEDGEILVRGPSIMMGYWNNPNATAEALDAGWLHTGDIGELDAEGYLHITDRKKDLIVNAGGENIPPQKIEMRLMADPYIEQAVVFGDRLPYLVALVYPQWDLVHEKLGSESGERDVQRLLRQHIDAALADLPAFEQVRRFALLPEACNEVDGTLTPTLKIRRRRVAERYAELLASLERDSVSRPGDRAY